MARKKISHELEEDAPTLDISSMVDVCFLLLIYFLVTTTIQPREQDLKMRLPVCDGFTLPDIAPMFIKVNQSGSVVLGLGEQEEPLDTNVDSRDLPMLKERLDVYVNSVKAAGKEPVVQVWADGEATQQRVVDVLNCLSSVAIKNITFTNLPDE